MQYVALLRGINVNGHRMVRMEDLRAMVADLGYGDVRTYIQSGNVVFRYGEAPAEALGRAIQEGIAGRFGLEDVPVVVLEGTELAGIVEGNPFVREGADPKWLYVTVLAQAPDPDRLGAIAVDGFLPDRFAVVGRCVYVHCPNGYHSTKLNNTWVERRLGGPATTRNWNTMVKLAAMAAE